MGKLVEFAKTLSSTLSYCLFWCVARAWDWMELVLLHWLAWLRWNSWRNEFGALLPVIIYQW